MKKKYYLIISLIVSGILLLNISNISYMTTKNGTGTPIIKHIPVKTTNIGYDLLISCDVIYSGNFIAQLMIRKPGVWQYNITNMTHGFGNTYYTIIPAKNVTVAGLEYYIKVYVNENITVTYPYSNASDNPLKILVRNYYMEYSLTPIYFGIIVILIFTILYVVDIIEIKNPWGGKKN